MLVGKIRALCGGVSLSGSGVQRTEILPGWFESKNANDNSGQKCDRIYTSWNRQPTITILVLSLE